MYKLSTNMDILKKVSCKKCHTGMTKTLWELLEIGVKKDLCMYCYHDAIENPMKRIGKMQYNGEFSNLTERQKCVIEALQSKGIDASTKDIIAEVEEMWEGRISVSERHVQRVRRAYLDFLKRDVDVFDTGEKPKATYYGGEDVEKSASFYTSKKTLYQKIKGASKMNVNEFGMYPWQQDLIQLVNEGDWTIKELCKEVNKDEVQVRNALETFKDLVFTNVLDENIDTVYHPIAHKTFDGVYRPHVRSNPTPKKQDDFWEVEIDCVNSCGKAPKEVKVRMSHKSREAVKLFMHWAGAREWLGYLVGKKLEDGSVEVHNIYLPDQRTSSTLVDQVVADKYNKMIIVGVIHSHHDMGAGDENHPSFSGHDANFINGNHDISLLAGNTKQGGFKVVGIARVKTPCGSLMKVKAKVVCLEENKDQVKAWKEEFFQKVFGKKLS